MNTILSTYNPSKSFCESNATTNQPVKVIKKKNKIIPLPNCKCICFYVFRSRCLIVIRLAIRLAFRLSLKNDTEPPRTSLEINVRYWCSEKKKLKKKTHPPSRASLVFRPPLIVWCGRRGENS